MFAHHHVPLWGQSLGGQFSLRPVSILDKMRRSPTEYGSLPAPEKIVTRTFVMRQGRVGRAHLREADLPVTKALEIPAMGKAPPTAVPLPLRLARIPRPEVGPSRTLLVEAFGTNVVLVPRAWGAWLGHRTSRREQAIS